MQCPIRRKLDLAFVTKKTPRYYFCNVITPSSSLKIPSASLVVINPAYSSRSSGDIGFQNKLFRKREGDAVFKNTIKPL